MPVDGATSIESDKKSLGTIVIPSGTFEYDRSLGDVYCAFSSELLRLSLLGIGGVGFLVTNLHYQPKSAEFLFLIAGCLLFLSTGAGAALMHRFLASDSLAFHIRALRLELRNAPGDREDSCCEKSGRQYRFWWSSICLWISGVALWLGVVCLGIAFLFALSHLSDIPRSM